MIKNELNEILIILAEECAELQQAATRIIRFGEEEGNVSRLQDEMGDILAMLSILDYKGVLDSDKIMERVPVKLKKLKQYSDITELDEILSVTK